MAKKKSQLRITLLYGLPGSGKTFYANQEKDNSNHNDLFKVAVIDFDNILKNYKNTLSLVKLRNAIERNVGSFSLISKINYDITIDGLFYNNKQIKKCINHIDLHFGEKFDISYTIVYWLENREYCLFNDKYRRKESSTHSINNIILEEPSISKVGRKFELKVKNVVKKSYYDLWIDYLVINEIISSNNFNKQNDILTSDRWSLGGTSCNCWGDSYSVSAGEPESFTDFKNILKDVCPQISFLEFDTLQEKCCRIETSSDSDYYGGSIDYQYHCCDMLELYKYLKNNNYLPKEFVDE